MDVADGGQLWGAQYNRTPSDILALQEEIANEISEALRLKLSAEEKAADKTLHAEHRGVSCISQRPLFLQ